MTTKIQHIELPVIFTNEYYMLEYSIIWKNFTNLYNKDKESKHQLKYQHRALYNMLVEAASLQLLHNNCPLESTKWLSIQGSVHPYLKVSMCSNKALHDRFERLEKAGLIIRDAYEIENIIGRKPISQKQNKEILINPDFLLIYDGENADYIPISPYRSLDEQPKDPMAITSFYEGIEYESCVEEFVLKTDKK